MSLLATDDVSGLAVTGLGWTGGAILRRFAFGLSDRPSFTKKVVVQPFPAPSLSSQMFPCIRATNLKAPEKAIYNILASGIKCFRD